MYLLTVSQTTPIVVPVERESVWSLTQVLLSPWCLRKHNQHWAQQQLEESIQG